MGWCATLVANSLKEAKRIAEDLGCTYLVVHSVHIKSNPSVNQGKGTLNQTACSLGNSPDKHPFPLHTKNARAVAGCPTAAVT
jgi:hypothetical protein